MRGALIVLEGIDGSGKTTLAGNLARALELRGRAILSTREPTDGPFGRRIRELARTGRDGVTPEEELALFMRDRADHVREVVRPALERGVIVVQDRSYFSTIAYQGQRGLDRARILEDSQRIAPEPDLLLVVDVPPEVALDRITRARGTPADDFERRTTLEQIRQVFLDLPQAVILDGTLPEAELARGALAEIDRVIGRA